LADRARWLSQLIVKRVGSVFQPIAQERHQGPAGASEEKKTSVTNELSEQASALVQDEEICEAIAAGVVYRCIESLAAARFSRLAALIFSRFRSGDA
jgi:hypothetical protein